MEDVKAFSKLINLQKLESPPEPITFKSTAQFSDSCPSRVEDSSSSRKSFLERDKNWDWHEGNKKCDSNWLGLPWGDAHVTLLVQVRLWASVYSSAHTRQKQIKQKLGGGGGTNYRWSRWDKQPPGSLWTHLVTKRTKLRWQKQSGIRWQNLSDNKRG